MIYDERRHKLVSDLYKRQTVFDFERAFVSGEDFGGVLREKKRKKENTRATRKKKEKW